jgi:thiamine pyrophosphokinase
MLSGQVLSDPGLLTWLADRSLLVCADGGARHLFRLGIYPDLLIGDFDSIGLVEHDWLTAAGVPAHQYPIAKDMTDSELAIEATLAMAREMAPDQPNSTIELVVLAAFGSRPDHVLANQLLAARLTREGYQVVLTDGLSILTALTGPGTVSLNLPAIIPVERWAFSAIPVSETVCGLTYAGLRYPLQAATLHLGTSRGVSNEPLSPPADTPGQPPAEKKAPPAISVELASGTIILILTPAL